MRGRFQHGWDGKAPALQGLFRLHRSGGQLADLFRLVAGETIPASPLGSREEK